MMRVSVKGVAMEIMSRLRNTGSGIGIISDFLSNISVDEHFSRKDLFFSVTLGLLCIVNVLLGVALGFYSLRRYLIARKLRQIDLITRKQMQIKEMQTNIKYVFCYRLEKQQEEQFITNSQALLIAIADISVISDTINHKLKQIKERQEDFLTQMKELAAMQLEQQTKFEKQEQDFIKINQAMLTCISDNITHKLKKIEENQKQMKEGYLTQMHRSFLTQPLWFRYILHIQMKNHKLTQIEEQLEESFLNQLLSSSHTYNNLSILMAATEISDISSDTINNTLKQIEERQEDFLTQMKEFAAMQLEQQNQFEKQQGQHIIKTNQAMLTYISDTINHKLKQIEEKQNKMQKAIHTYVQADSCTKQLLCQILSISN